MLKFTVRWINVRERQRERERERESARAREREREERELLKMCTPSQREESCLDLTNLPFSPGAMSQKI
jgi:hypothetical protein